MDEKKQAMEVKEKNDTIKVEVSRDELVQDIQLLQGDEHVQLYQKVLMGQQRYKTLLDKYAVLDRLDQITQQQTQPKKEKPV